MSQVIGVLLLAGIVFIGTGIGIIVARRGGADRYTRARAVVDTVMLGESAGTVKPIVVFQDGGNDIRQSAQEIRANLFTAQPGDEIGIAYRKTSVGGANFWDIVVDTGDVDRVLDGQKNLAMVIGWLFSGIGAVIIIVAIALLRR